MLSQALAIAPNSTKANAFKGLALIGSGQQEKGREFIQKAIRLDPRDPRTLQQFNNVACSYYYERDYINAMVAARFATARYENNTRGYVWLAAALGQLGHIEDAREALHRAATISPPKSLDMLRIRAPWARPQDYEHMLEGLRKAGWSG